MNHTIKIKEVPHNGKPITKIEISPQSRYIVTYSQEDKSFVGWCGKVSKVIQKKNSYVEYIKNNINPRIELLLGIKDNQDDELNDDNDDSGPLIVDDKVQPYNLDLDISDYKVSDNKIIMYEGNDELAIIYDMKNKKKITLNSSFKKYADDKYKFNFPYYKFTNFLTSGDLATYNVIENNSWKCKSTHELDDMNTMEINFGGITNGRFIYIQISENSARDKGSNLENSIKYNTLIKYFLETNGNSNYFDYFNNIQFRLNDQKVFGIFYEKPWMINIKKCDLETYIINNNSIYSEETNNTKESINENIFYIIGKQFTVAEDENEFIKMYIIPNLMNSSENKSGYDMRLKSDNGEIILEAFINNSSQNEIVSSYNIKYSKSWKDIKANNTYILYDETELHIYTFNIEFNKIELQCCYNIKFLKYAFRLYNNNKPAADALRIEEIEEIAQPTDNDGLKMQWILFFKFNHDL
uniref:Uncharacterized protein n=1 Tax=Rhizophagus irregularis (strain DAOM 181602 / DAOM 197198 / MUCL 43194) TaxID=747089 RepID=U9TV21_RHIID